MHCLSTQLATNSFAHALMVFETYEHLDIAKAYLVGNDKTTVLFVTVNAHYAYGEKTKHIALQQ